MSSADYLSALTEGKPRGKGRADEIAQHVLQKGEDALAELWPGLYHTNPAVRTRTARVVELVARQHPSWLTPYYHEILQRLALPTLDPALFFHIPPLLGLLTWPDEDVPQAIERLEHWLTTIDHKFVKVFCLQSLADISWQQPWLQAEVIELLHQHMAKGGKAMNARGRMLLKQFQKQKKLA